MYSRETTKLYSHFNLPSNATLHHFVKYRLGKEGFNEIMFRIGKKICRITKE